MPRLRLSENKALPQITRVTSTKAIRLKCLDCTGNQPKEVRLCPIVDCPLWSFRMGKRPNNPVTLQANDEALAARNKTCPR